MAQLLKRYKGHIFNRTFLAGANPFVLKFERLMEIADLIHKYVPSGKTIGGFARVTDITLKSDEEMEALHGAGYDGLAIVSCAGRGEIGAKVTVEVCNPLHPLLVGSNMLAIYPDSELYQEIQQEVWKEEGELEKYKEIQLEGTLPRDRDKPLATLGKMIKNVSEEELRAYRVNLPHL